jgi:anti-sigma factor RsiW
VFAVKQHLDDNVLIRRYLADRGLSALEASDEAPLRHLAHCPACEARYEALRAAFDDTREAALADAEAVCTAERMDRQRERILRRVDALQSGPRVLPFPAAGQAGHAAPQPRVFRRWVAAAAVAGLLVGLGAGRMVFNGGDARTTAVARQQITPAAAGAARQVPTVRAVNANTGESDDQFLSEIEMATAAPRTRELRAIYAFTLEESRDVPRTVGKD